MITKVSKDLTRIVIIDAILTDTCAINSAKSGHLCPRVVDPII